MTDLNAESLEAQGIHGPTPEDLEDARNPRDTLWKRLTSSTAARAIIVAVSGLGALNGIGHLLDSGAPEQGAYTYAVTQLENGTRYTREHVTGVEKEGILSATAYKNVQTVTVSADRSEVIFTVGHKSETYVAGRKNSEKDLGSRFIAPGAVSMHDVGDRTAGFYQNTNALNNRIFDVQAAEKALQRIPAIEAKREKYAETIRIIEEEQGGIDNAWARLVKYNKLDDIAEKHGMGAFFIEHARVMTQAEMDSYIKVGDSVGWRLPSGEVVPAKDVVKVLADKGTFTAFDGKEFSYTSHTDLFRQVTEHYRFSAAMLAPHVHKYDGADDMGGIPGPVSPEKVADAKETVSDFNRDYGSYKLAGVKVSDLFRQDTIRLSESFAQKAKRPQAPVDEAYDPNLMTEQDAKRIEKDGNSMELLVPATGPSPLVTVTQMLALKGPANK